MINNSLKAELEKLKGQLQSKIHSDYPISYGEVIKFLLFEYKKSKPKMKAKVIVSIPLSKAPAINFGKLENNWIVL